MSEVKSSLLPKLGKRSAPALPVSMALHAPSGWAWWCLSLLYLSAFALPSNGVMALVALLTFSSVAVNGTHPQQAVWLWVTGFAAATVVLILAITWKPEGVSMVAWLKADTWRALAVLISSLAAFFVLLWHMSWLRPESQ